MGPDFLEEVTNMRARTLAGAGAIVLLSGILWSARADDDGSSNKGGLPACQSDLAALNQQIQDTAAAQCLPAPNLPSDARAGGIPECKEDLAQAADLLVSLQTADNACGPAVQKTR
jgi:hypothetical protein